MEQIDDNALQEALVRRNDDVDRARAQEYALLATLLSRSPDAEMLARLALVRGDASVLDAAHAALAEVAAKANIENVKVEYFDLFAGLGRSRFLPYASYYLTGSLYGRPLARLREALHRLGIERAEHRSPRIMPRSFARLWQGSRAAKYQRQRKLNVKSSRSISRLGSDVSLPIWSVLTRPPSMRAWARSAVPSWRLKLKPSRSRFQGRRCKLSWEVGERSCAFSSLRVLWPQ